jgi:hypothetical protein
MKRKVLLSTLLTPFLFQLIACTQDYRVVINEEFTPLINEGIIAVGESSSHLASNIFLAEEAENNRYLRRFLKQRGFPQAIKLAPAESALALNLYYPSDLEQYKALKKLPPNEDSPRTEWLITGPQPIKRREYNELKSLLNHLESKNNYSEPLPPLNHNNKEILPPLLPIKKIVAKSSGKTKHIGEDNKNLAQGKTDKRDLNELNPKNFDQEAIALSRGIALRNPAGDLVHKTNELNQKISDIAAWYTDSTVNTERIASYNNHKPEDSLVIGEEILIPKDLVKRALIYKFQHQKQ